MPTALLNGVELFYEVTGRGDQLVLTHGSWTDGNGWSAAVDTLADRYEVVTWDRRGHSRSQDGQGPGSRAEDAADLAALIDHIGDRPVHLAGNSYGTGAIRTSRHLCRSRTLASCNPHRRMGIPLDRLPPTSLRR